MKKKIAREEARELESKELRLAKEREISRLRKLQEKALDQKAITEELKAKQIAEEVYFVAC